MKIAQIAPLIESVPPKFYGGTERVVSYLTEELVRQGHDVTLFASGDSQTRAKLVPSVPRALRLDTQCRNPIPHQILQLEHVRQRAHDFDILHFHVDCLHFPIFRDIGYKCVTTLHGRQDLPDLYPFYAEFTDMPLVSISNSQRGPLGNVYWAGTVYHGLPAETCLFNPAPRGDYFAFLGRISPEKRLDRAIEIAKGAGMHLKVAAKVDKADERYYAECIEPLLDKQYVEFVGEIGENDKTEFLGNAKALLFPIDWPEPFGLVMIESMSCGTPVLAWNEGSVAEVIDDGVTGYVVDNMEQAIEKARVIADLDREAVRRRYNERFSAAHMTRHYVDIYKRLLSSESALEKICQARVA